LFDDLKEHFGTLAWLTRTMQQDGAIAAFGNAGGAEFTATVLPFFLRGVGVRCDPLPSFGQHRESTLARDDPEVIVER
jgi:hypothetical protein